MKIFSQMIDSHQLFANATIYLWQNDVRCYETEMHSKFVIVKQAIPVRR